MEEKERWKGTEQSSHVSREIMPRILVEVLSSERSHTLGPAWPGWVGPLALGKGNGTVRPHRSRRPHGSRRPSDGALNIHVWFVQLEYLKLLLACELVKLILINARPSHASRTGVEKKVYSSTCGLRRTVQVHFDYRWVSSSGMIKNLHPTASVKRSFQAHQTCKHGWDEQEGRC